MDNMSYLHIVASYYMCDLELASKIIKSAELNGSKKELDKLVSQKGKDFNENSNP